MAKSHVVNYALTTGLYVGDSINLPFRGIDEKEKTWIQFAVGMIGVLASYKLVYI